MKTFLALNVQMNSLNIISIIPNIPASAMTPLHGSNCGYFHLTCHMSRGIWGSLLNCGGVCRWRGLAPLCPPNTTSPPLGSSLLYVPLSSPQDMSQNPEGQKHREWERERTRGKDWWGEIRDKKRVREEKRCNLKLGISVTQIGVRFQESNNTAASKNIYSLLFTARSVGSNYVS